MLYLFQKSIYSLFLSSDLKYSTRQSYTFLLPTVIIPDFKLSRQDSAFPCSSQSNIAKFIFQSNLNLNKILSSARFHSSWSAQFIIFLTSSSSIKTANFGSIISSIPVYSVSSIWIFVVFWLGNSQVSLICSSSLIIF
ncbi:TPA: hypothetical protein DEG21_03230 [Patescibacteria group bacterium]|nr:hypothetical protein [Candidatus Gracilibacteria bacterium]HBY74872.1 hypothetical protein [Candidatus Gracilibacteria bacterium]